MPNIRYQKKLTVILKLSKILGILVIRLSTQAIK